MYIGAGRGRGRVNSLSLIEKWNILSFLNEKKVYERRKMEYQKKKGVQTSFMCYEYNTADFFFPKKKNRKKKKKRVLILRMQISKKIKLTVQKKKTTQCCAIIHTCMELPTPRQKKWNIFL